VLGTEEAFLDGDDEVAGLLQGTLARIDGDARNLDGSAVQLAGVGGVRADAVDMRPGLDPGAVDDGRLGGANRANQVSATYGVLRGGCLAEGQGGEALRLDGDKALGGLRQDIVHGDGLHRAHLGHGPQVRGGLYASADQRQAGGVRVSQQAGGGGGGGGSAHAGQVTGVHHGQGAAGIRLVEQHHAQDGRRAA
jgi:hypothetical protein